MVLPMELITMKYKRPLRLNVPDMFAFINGAYTLYLFTSTDICEITKHKWHHYDGLSKWSIYASCNCGQFEGITDVTKQIGFGY